MSHIPPQTAEIPEDALKSLQQAAAEVHYAFQNKPGRDRPSRDATDFARQFRASVKKMAIIVSSHEKSVRALPEVALGALYEYNRSKTGKPAPEFDFMEVRPLVGKDVPSRYRRQRLEIRGDNAGQVPLLEKDRVEERWWERRGESSATK